ncbi:MAG: hypothetical protein PGN13_06380 [Patulibacter minatonensis]
MTEETRTRDEARAQRRARIAELARQARYAAAVPEAARQVSAILGVELDADDAVTKEAVDAARRSVGVASRGHLVWHRIWGVRLYGEMLEAAGRLGDLLGDERALLLWPQPEHPTVGLLVPLGPALNELPAWLHDDERFPGADLVLLSELGESGLVLEFNAHAHAEEYELHSWGRYARPVSA